MGLAWLSVCDLSPERRRVSLFCLYERLGYSGNRDTRLWEHWLAAPGEDAHGGSIFGPGCSAPLGPLLLSLDLRASLMSLPDP